MLFKCDYINNIEELSHSIRLIFLVLKQQIDILIRKEEWLCTLWLDENQTLLM